MRGGFSGRAQVGFDNMSYGNNYQSANTNNYANPNVNKVVGSGISAVGSTIPSEWSANVPSHEIADTVRIRITELIRPVTEEEMRKVFNRVGVQVRQLCVEPPSSPTETSVLVQFIDASVAQHAMTLLNNRFIYNNAHKMTMNYAPWNGGITTTTIKTTTYNNNNNVFAQGSNFNMNNDTRSSNAVLPTLPQAAAMLPPSPLHMMTNKPTITSAETTQSPSVFTSIPAPMNKNTTNSNTINNFAQSNANNLTPIPHQTNTQTPFTSISSVLPHSLPLQSQPSSASSLLPQQMSLFNNSNSSNINNSSSHIAQGIFNPSLPLPFAPSSSSSSNSYPVQMPNASTMKNISSTSNYNTNNSLCNTTNMNNTVYNNSAIPMPQLSGSVIPAANVSIMPEPSQTGFSNTYGSTTTTTTNNNNTNNTITNTNDPFGSIFGSNNNSSGQSSSGLRGRGRGRGRGRRDMNYVNHHTSNPSSLSSSSSAALMPSTLRNAPMNFSTISSGFNPMVPMTQPSMIPIPFLNALPLPSEPGLGAMPHMLPPMTPPINPNDVPTVFLSMTVMPTTEPLQSLFVLIEAYGGVVSIRRNNEKRHIVTVKMNSIEEANNVLQYFHRIPFANEKISAKRFPGYHERNPCTDDGDPLNAETIQYDFTASRHRSPKQRSRSYPTCMVKISGCGGYVEADVMTYLNSKSFYPQRIHKEVDGTFTVQLDDA